MINYKKKILSQIKNNNIIFNAVLLTPQSKKILLDKFPPRHAKTYDCHVTLEFKPKEFPNKLGEIVKLKVFGIAMDEMACAVAVQLYDVNSNNEIPHITISTANNVNPVYSNDLLSKGYDAIEPFDLDGTVVANIKGKGYITSLPQQEILPSNTTQNAPKPPLNQSNI